MSYTPKNGNVDGGRYRKLKDCYERSPNTRMDCSYERRKGKESESPWSISVAVG